MRIALCRDTAARQDARNTWVKGKLDIVFANAGAARFAPFGTITEEFYDSNFNINVKGFFSRCRKRYR
jgi:NAD(P)-dependent dehydrogenase (short-subunit alcohol dehydrogenase family)